MFAKERGLRLGFHRDGIEMLKSGVELIKDALLFVQRRNGQPKIEECFWV